MSATLLVTKLYFPPVRPILVPRARLVKRLQTGLQGPLTLIAAPAGYGKTTLLGEWRASAGTPPPVAWLSLDAGDNDPVRFLLYLTAALDQVKANLTKNTCLLLQSPELPAVDVIGTTLLNELSAFEGDLVIALDDYHVIISPEIHAVLAFLIDHLLPNVHLVILTRADPPLPLARLRARGQLTEIRAADLRFTVQEAAAFLNEAMGLSSLSVQDVAALDARTEGWIAGLQLAALSMQGRDDHEHFISAFSGSHQYIVDYLAEEVLNRQPGFVREFLLKTSVLERLTGTLCDALTGRADGQATLEMLAQANLFLIPLDDERCWFRYHHLFADLLRNRLRLNLPEQVVELHRRAAAWYHQKDLTGEAIPYALAAGDFQFVVDVISKNWLRLARQYRLNVVVQWIESLPEPILGNHPRLSAVHAYALWSLGLKDAAAEHLQRAQQVLEGKVAAGQMQTSDQEYLTLQTEIKAFWSLLASHAGDLDTAIGRARSALAIAPGTAPFACAVASTSLYVAQRNNLEMEQAIESCRQAIAYSRDADHRVMAADAYYNLGLMLMIQGRLRQAKDVILEGQRYIESLGETYLPPYGVLDVGLAEICCLQHELDQAQRYISRGVQLIESSGRLTGYLHSRIVEAKLLYSLRQISAARQIIDEACQTIQNTRVRQYDWDEAGYWMARIMAAQGDFTPAVEWAKGLQGTYTSHPRYTYSAGAIRLACILAAVGKPQEALQTLAGVKPVLEQAGCNGWLVDAYVLEAVCRAKLEQKPAALAALRQALALAEPEEYLQVFLDQGYSMAELLILARKQGARPEFIDRLLACFGPNRQEERALTAAARPRLVTPLSKREIELLGLIAAGCSNKEIAGKLVISIGTVKRHTVNIFNKLDAKNRTEAVAKARELRIL